MKRLAFLLLMTLSLSAAAEMGRLFFTPAERARLNELRANAKTVELADQTDPEAAEVVTPPSDVSVQGYVKRSDGKKSTVWVNGQPVQEYSSNGQVEVGKLESRSNQIQLKIPATGKVLNLKAGQKYDFQSDQLSEAKASKNKEVESIGEAGSIAEPQGIPSEVLNKLREVTRK